AQIRHIFLDGYDVLVVRIVFFKISSFKLQNAMDLLWFDVMCRPIYSSSWKALVRQAHLVDTDTESEPEEAPSKIEECQPLVFRAPLTDEEFEVLEPSDTRITSSHSSSSSDSITPLSPDPPLTQASPTLTPTRVSFHRRTARMVVRIQPTLSSGMSARIAEAAALSPSSFYLDTEREGSKDEGHGLEDEGPGIEEEEATPKGQQQVVLVVDTTADEPLRLGYGALRHRELVVGEGEMPNMFKVGQISRFMTEHEGAERVSAFRQPTLVTWVDPEDARVYTDILTYEPPVAPVQTPPSLEWSSGSLPVSPSPLVVPSPIASPVTTPAATISRLDALPPTLFEAYDRDLRELYTRSGAVKNEIFLQRYRFRSLKPEQERATMIFSAIWRPILALEAWASQTNAQRAALWHVIYGIQRENHDLRR
ncbi:hypothetical protein Tco_1102381, partial [Tanacetum coccineum]